MKANSSNQSPYEIVIEPNRKWFYIDWRGILQYRDLLFLLVRRDFIAKYKQTILGPTWFILQPLLTTIVFTIFFHRVAKVSTDGLPPHLFYLCSLMVWNYFANCLKSTANSLVANTNIFSKVYFPRLIVPLSSVISNLFTFGIQLGTFLVFYLYFKFFLQGSENIQPNLLMIIVVLPLLLVQAAAFSLGVGLWISALTTKYRDLVFLMGFLTQLWLYATPVIYPVSAIPAHWRFIMAINPMAAIVDFYRYAFFGTLALSSKYLFLSVVTTMVVLVSGLLAFNKVERTFVDTI
ncbi:MAG: ABC transporter permease [Omnitrophica bacterium]|nr:ABC transporter permease [Candidatus Omnitrophota bacterium]